VGYGQIHTLHVLCFSITTFEKIHHLIVGSSSVCIGSVVGRLRSRLASLSGLGGSGFGLGVGVGGDEGGRVDSLHILRLKVINDGDLSFILELF